MDASTSDRGSASPEHNDAAAAAAAAAGPKPPSAGTTASQKKDLGMSIVTQPVVNDVSNPVSARSIPQTPYTASPDHLHIRCLVTMKEAGVIIGKQGKNIADIRERSTAKVMVSELQQGAHERIITISGSLEVVARAFSMLAKKVLEEFQLNAAAEGTSRGVPDTQHNIRLLIPHNRMGGIIGKGGAKIKEIQEVSGARLNASEEMLPNSTERIITVRGVPDMIHIAIYHIGLILIEGNEKYPDRSTIQYKPLAKYYQHASPGIYSPTTTSAMHAPPLPAPGSRPRYSQPQSPVAPPKTPRGQQDFDGQIPHVLPVGHEQQQIFIPNDMVGCIIGKGGNRIKEIRQQSQCQVRVAESGNAQGERLITISGSPEGCQMALYMLYNRLEDEKKRALERPNGLAQ